MAVLCPLSTSPSFAAFENFSADGSWVVPVGVEIAQVTVTSGSGGDGGLAVGGGPALGGLAGGLAGRPSNGTPASTLTRNGTDGGGAAKRIIHEAIASAYRHGRATECDVDINCDASHIAIKFADNGAAPSGEATPGIGGAILNSICGGKWNVEINASGGRILHAKFAQDSHG